MTSSALELSEKNSKATKTSVKKEPQLKQISNSHTSMSLLCVRWQQLRIDLIREQLYELTGLDFFIYFKQLYQNDSTNMSKSIAIDLNTIPKSNEVLAALLASQWAILKYEAVPEDYRHLLKNQNSTSMQTEEDKQDEITHFIAIFLAHYEYPIDKILSHLLYIETIASQNGQTIKLAPKKVLKTYMQALTTKQEKIKV